MAQGRNRDDLPRGLKQRFGLVKGKPAQQHGARRDGLGRVIGRWRFVEKAAGQKYSVFWLFS